MRSSEIMYKIRENEVKVQEKNVNELKKFEYNKSDQTFQKPIHISIFLSNERYLNEIMSFHDQRFFG